MQKHLMLLTVWNDYWRKLAEKNMESGVKIWHDDHVTIDLHTGELMYHFNYPDAGFRLQLNDSGQTAPNGAVVVLPDAEIYDAEKAIGGRPVRNRRATARARSAERAIAEDGNKSQTKRQMKAQPAPHTQDRLALVEL